MQLNQLKKKKCSLTHSVTQCLSLSLSLPHARSLHTTHSLTHSLTHSQCTHAHSLTPLTRKAHTLARSLTISPHIPLLNSLMYSHTHTQHTRKQHQHTTESVETLSRNNRFNEYLHHQFKITFSTSKVSQGQYIGRDGRDLAIFTTTGMSTSFSSSFTSSSISSLSSTSNMSNSGGGGPTIKLPIFTRCKIGRLFWGFQTLVC